MAETKRPISGNPTKSYLVFESVSKRSLNLLTTERLVERLIESLPESPGELSTTDMARAAVVLSVAAMDSYFTDVFTERLVLFIKLKGTNQKLTELLAEAGLDTKAALQLFQTDRPWRRIRTLVANHLEKRTTQRFATIDDLFLGYGIKGLCSHAERFAKRKTLLRSVQKLVERRHKIVHEGDMNAHRKLNDIDSTKIKTRIADVVKFVSACDEILQRQVAVN